MVGIQARSGSTRLPGKIYKKLGRKSMLEVLYNRVKSIPNTKEYELFPIVIGHTKDKKLKEFCNKKRLAYWGKGQENNLLERYVGAMHFYDLNKGLIRLTSDCPLVPPVWIQQAADRLAHGFDYVTNCNPRTVVDGHDVQGISRKGLDWYASKMKKGEEHLFFQMENDCNLQSKFLKTYKMQAMFSYDIKILNPFHPMNKLSVDTIGDFKRVQYIYETMGNQS